MNLNFRAPNVIAYFSLSHHSNLTFVSCNENLRMSFVAKLLAVGVWEQLDKVAESLAEKHGKVYIASGPVIQYPKHPRYSSISTYSTCKCREKLHSHALDKITRTTDGLMICLGQL